MIRSWVAFSLCTLSVCANEQEREVATHLLEEIGKILILHEDQKKQEQPKEEGSETVSEKKKTLEKRKQKAHFAGTRRPQEDEEQKKEGKLKNEWVVSKTYPKTKKKKESQGKAALAHIQEETKAPARPLAITSKSTSSQASLVQKVDALQSQVNFLADEVHASDIQPIFKAPRGFCFAFAEWLFWTVKEEGTSFVLSKQEGRISSLNGSKDYATDFSWTSGVRGGIGFHLPQDHWDVVVSYTNIHPISKVGVEGVLAPLFIFQGSTSDFDTVEKATSDWYLVFQTADLEIGKSCPVTQKLLLRPFLGLRGAWISQKVDLAYYQRLDAVPYKIHGENPFKGVGGMFGCDSNWQLGYGVSFYANGALALLAGTADTEQTQVLPIGRQTVSLQEHKTTLSPMVQYVTGFAWDRNFHKDKWHVGIELGFEAQYWWSQNQLAVFTSDVLPIHVTAQGGLGLYGVDLSVRFDF